MALWDVFQEMQKHVSHYGNLSFGNVKQMFGKIELNSISAYPHLNWLPTTDEYISPLSAALPQIIGGRHVHQESFYTRKSGCDVRLLHKDYASMEIFINDFHNAIYDVLPVLGTSSNIGKLEIGSGQWMDREGINDNSVCYVQSIYVYVPIYRLKPAAIAETTMISLPA